VKDCTGVNPNVSDQPSRKSHASTTTVIASISIFKK
jgi:hypothetical protein